MPVQGTYSRSGQRVTVNRMTKDPLLVPRRQLKLMDHQFIFEDLLRSVGTPSSGIIAYEEETPLFADDQPSEVEEGAEIPTTTGQDGLTKSVRTVKLARALEITREDRDRNKIDKVNRRMDQIKNTFVREYEQRFFDTIEAASILTQAAGTVWATSTNIREDILRAVEQVSTARVALGGNNGDSPLGFNPDTLVLPESAKYDLLISEDFSKHYVGNMADENIQFSGKLPNKVLGLDVLVSRHLDQLQGGGVNAAAYVMQRKEVGGYGDERPMQTTPLYEDKDRETWRSNVVRRTGIFIDQPKAVCKITGIAS